MASYVLIHGAWHGAWCWDKVVPLLQQQGHTAIAIDLPAHGKDFTPLTEVSLQLYADKICEAVSQQQAPVILVGHSLGGISITQAAEQCSSNIRKLVYLSGFLLPNGVARLGYGSGVEGSLLEANKKVSDDKTSVSFKPAGLKDTFYHDCSADDIAKAIQLTRPEPMAGIVSPVNYTKENFGRIPRVYIECLQDRAIPLALQKRMYTETPVTQVVTMDTSHSPFFSAADELVEHLIELAG
ncbi:MAG: alpha/beta fold hydrolase [Cycloclasticus pugetii]|uniref:alpha/beta fold hydrolase n=1 Tax=Cycloclasticus pugetii TaxID=34068 RepID=UPI003A93B7E5